MKKNRLIILFEILFVVVAFTYYIIKIMIPEYNSTHGSSDHLLNYNKYQSMYEFLYEDGTNFSIILDSDNKVYHILFFDKNSLILYNHKIEGSKLDEVIEYIFKIIKCDNLIITCYDSDNNYIKSITDKYDISIIYNESSIEDKSQSLGLNVNSRGEMLEDLDFYSKEIIKKYNNSNNISSNTNSNIDTGDIFINYSRHVYSKLDEFVKTNNINDLDSNSSLLLIETIPADSSLEHYPNSNSYYYVKDSRVYSYIEFDSDTGSVGYCYSGSIDDVAEGMCS